MSRREIPLADPAWLSPAEALGRRPEVPHLERDARPDEAAARYGFKVGDLGLLLGPGTSGEIVDSARVHPVPNTAPWFKGVVNLRGNLVPVFDLGELLHGEPGAGERLLVADRGARAAAFPVAEMPRAVRLGEAVGDAPAVPDALRDHVTRSYVVEEQAWLEIDMHGFLESLSERIPL